MDWGEVPGSLSSTTGRDLSRLVIMKVKGSGCGGGGGHSSYLCSSSAMFTGIFCLGDG